MARHNFAQTIDRQLLAEYLNNIQGSYGGSQIQTSPGDMSGRAAYGGSSTASDIMGTLALMSVFSGGGIF